MEELLAYALMCCEGYDFWNLYSEQLDKLYLESPDNEELLNLEYQSSPKQAALHVISIMSERPFNTGLFGRTLVKLIEQVYMTSDLLEFSAKMYSLWNRLPSAVIHEEPFFTFCYADDCLSYGDEQQCRKLYERAIHYYD